MNKYFMMMVAVSTLGLAACDDTTKTESTQKAETTNGTVVERHTTTETTSDGDGNVERKTKIETTADPAGLMNKETSTQESTESQKKD